MTDTITVTVHGPIVDGRAVAVTHQMCEAATEVVAAQAYANVMTNLNASIAHPTPYYETQVTVTNRSHTERSVNDRGVIYGPWLEGTSTRNRTTRFKGYASFRRAAQKTQAETPRLVQHAVDTLIGRIR